MSIKACVLIEKQCVYLMYSKFHYIFIEICVYTQDTLSLKAVEDVIATLATSNSRQTKRPFSSSGLIDTISGDTWRSNLIHDILALTLALFSFHQPFILDVCFSVHATTGRFLDPNLQRPGTCNCQNSPHAISSVKCLNLAIIESCN